jgi:uncharacterized membrane protein
MTQKKFKLIRILTAMFLAAIMAQAVIFSNYILAIIAVVGAVLVIFTSAKKVEGVSSDERTISIGGRAARMSVTIFSVLGAGISFVLIISRGAGAVYEATGYVLSYSVCALLILYSSLFKYYEKQN